MAVVLFFTGGGGLYVFPVFIASFQDEFGWSITQISISAALFAIVMGFSNPLVGALFARFGARRTMLVAGALTALTSLCYAALQNLGMLYATVAVSGFAVAGTTILPAQTVLLVVIPLIAVFVRTRPSDLGLRPDGESRDAETGAGPASSVSGLPVKRAVATPTFWLLVGVFLLQLIGVSALNFHFVPFAEQEAGFTSQEAAFYYGLAVGFSIVGRLLFGWLADRWHPTLLMVLAYFLLTLGPVVIEVLFIRLSLREASLLSLYAIPYGIGIGANAVVMTVIVGRCFGQLHFSKVMGLLMSGFAVGIIIGIPVAGWIFDRTGSYEWVMILCALGLLLATALAAFIRPERHQREFTTT
jgi:MFS family permease